MVTSMNKETKEHKDYLCSNKLLVDDLCIFCIFCKLLLNRASRLVLHTFSIYIHLQINKGEIKC